MLKFALRAGCHWVVAIDIDVARLSRARRRSGLDAHVIRASATNLPLRDNTLDKIAMVEVLEHVPKRGEIKALMEIHRVLKKSGRLFLSTPNKLFPFVILDPAFFFGHRHYSPEELKVMLAASGLRTVRHGTYGGVAEAVLTPAFYLMRKLGFDIYEMPPPMLEMVDREYDSASGYGYTLVVECVK